MKILYIFPGRSYRLLGSFLKESEVRIGYELRRDLSKMKESARIRYIESVLRSRKKYNSEIALKASAKMKNSFFQPEIEFCVIPEKGNMRFHLVRLYKKIEFDRKNDMYHSRKFEYLSAFSTKKPVRNNKGVSFIQAYRYDGLTDLIVKYARDANSTSIENISLPAIELWAYEGKALTILRKHLSRERSLSFMKKYKLKYSHVKKCQACGFNPEDNYQKIRAIQMLEMHHILPIGKRSASQVTREKDVVLLCPNCHRAIHKVMAEELMKSISLRSFKKNIKSKFNNR